MAAKKPPESYPTFIVKRFEELTGAYNTLKSLVRSIEDFRREFEDVTIDHADRLDIVAGAALLASNNVFTGINTNTAQPAFLVRNSGGDANKTGNGDTVTIEFDNEFFDQDNNFDSITDTFTAPVTGRYLLNYTIRMNQLDTLVTAIISHLVTSNRTYINAAILSTPRLTGYSVHDSIVVDMDANDTATITLIVTGMAANTVDINGGNVNTSFSGCLLV